MKDRIQAIISAKQIKKVEFARRLNLSQPFVSELCSGKGQPSERTILDICREFDVNETWLRTGEGEMLITLTRSQEISDFIGRVLKGEDDTFKRRLVAMLARLDESDWEVLEKMVEGMKKD